MGSINLPQTLNSPWGKKIHLAGIFLSLIFGLYVPSIGLLLATAGSLWQALRVFWPNNYWLWSGFWILLNWLWLTILLGNWLTPVNGSWATVLIITIIVVGGKAVDYGYLQEGRQWFQWIKLQWFRILALIIASWQFWATDFEYQTIGIQAFILASLIWSNWVIGQKFKLRGQEQSTPQASTEEGHSTEEEDDEEEPTDDYEKSHQPTSEPAYTTSSDSDITSLPESLKPKLLVIQGVQKVGESLVINNSQVALNLVVNNTISQERMFEAKKQAQQLLEKSGYERTYIQLSYQVEDEGLV
jgi:hypothetical protein